MSKGIAALSYLPELEVNITSSTASPEAIKAAVKKIGQFQQEGTANGTYTGVQVGVGTPYNKVVATYVLASNVSDVTLEITASGSDLPVAGGLNRAALSTRRDITVSTSEDPENCTVRSMLAALSFVQKLEDQVASSGDGATGDGTYTDISVKGHTPYESYVWTVVKSGSTYTLTSTANS